MARLQAAGLLAPPGLATVERAKADGSWDRLVEVDGLAVPPDLDPTLAAEPVPRRISRLSRRRRGILEWIVQERRPETRAGRLAETVAAALAGQRAHAWRAKPG